MTQFLSKYEHGTPERLKEYREFREKYMWTVHTLQLTNGDMYRNGEFGYSARFDNFEDAKKFAQEAEYDDVAVCLDGSDDIYYIRVKTLGELSK